MKFQTGKDVVIIKESESEFGIRFACNLSPEEMKKRKEEIIRDFFERWKFEWGIELVREGCTPTPCKNLNGFWSYFVKFN